MTSHTGELMVRQEDRPTQRRAVLLLDTRACAHSGGARSASLEWAVSMCRVGRRRTSSRRGYAVHLLTAEPEQRPRGRRGRRARRGTRHPGAHRARRRRGLPRRSPMPRRPLPARAGSSSRSLGGLDDDAARATASLRQPGSTGARLRHRPGRLRAGQGGDRGAGDGADDALDARRAPGGPPSSSARRSPSPRPGAAVTSHGRWGLGPMSRARPVDAAARRALRRGGRAAARPACSPPARLGPPSLLLLLVVAGVGTLLRSRVVTAWLVGRRDSSSPSSRRWPASSSSGTTLWFGLPGPGALRAAWHALLEDAYQNVQTHAAPAPTTQGTIFALAGLIALTALAVDYLAVTRRTPTAAGLPLLAAYLSAATNSGAGLAAFYFVVPAAVWVTMVGRQGVTSVRRWATAVTRSDSERAEPGDPDDAALDFAALGRVLGVGHDRRRRRPHPASCRTCRRPSSRTVSGGPTAPAGAGAVSTSPRPSTSRRASGASPSNPVLVYKAPNRAAADPPAGRRPQRPTSNGQWTRGTTPGRHARRTGSSPRPRPPRSSVLDAEPDARSSRTASRLRRWPCPTRRPASPPATPRSASTSRASSASGPGRRTTPPTSSRSTPWTATSPETAPALVGQGYLEVDRASVQAVSAAAAKAIPATAGARSRRPGTSRPTCAASTSPTRSTSLPSRTAIDPITAFLGRRRATASSSRRRW